MDCTFTFAASVVAIWMFASSEAIDSITWQDQETYLTDVLYDLLSEKYRQGTEDVYRRILIISISFQYGRLPARIGRHAQKKASCQNSPKNFP